MQRLATIRTLIIPSLLLAGRAVLGACPTAEFFTDRDAFVIDRFEGKTDDLGHETFELDVSTSFNGHRATCAGERSAGAHGSDWLACENLGGSGDEAKGGEEEDSYSFHARRSHVPQSFGILASGLGEWFEFEHEFICDNDDDDDDDDNDNANADDNAEEDQTRASVNVNVNVTGAGCMAMQYYYYDGIEHPDRYQTYGLGLPGQPVRVTRSSAASAASPSAGPPYDFARLGCRERFFFAAGGGGGSALEVVDLGYAYYASDPFAGGFTNMAFTVLSRANGSFVRCEGRPAGSLDGDYNNPAREWSFQCGLDSGLPWKRTCDAINFGIESTAEAELAWALTEVVYENAPNTLTITQSWNCTAANGEVTSLKATGVLQLPDEIGSTQSFTAAGGFEVPAVLV
ncbi:hypothetical protein F4778DRAFT_392650 [Xylariomycetidae sp. FL2044]|nr:hypothetical protein F4778DRAFT_392650 [Xylariomycetidae sp. FL2044]